MFSEGQRLLSRSCRECKVTMVFLQFSVQNEACAKFPMQRLPLGLMRNLCGELLGLVFFNYPVSLGSLPTLLQSLPSLPVFFPLMLMLGVTRQLKYLNTKTRPELNRGLFTVWIIIKVIIPVHSKNEDAFSTMFRKSLAFYACNCLQRAT